MNNKIEKEYCEIDQIQKWFYDSSSQNGYNFELSLNPNYNKIQVSETIELQEFLKIQKWLNKSLTELHPTYKNCKPASVIGVSCFPPSRDEVNSDYYLHNNSQKCKAAKSAYNKQHYHLLLRLSSAIIKKFDFWQIEAALKNNIYSPASMHIKKLNAPIDRLRYSRYQVSKKQRSSNNITLFIL